MMNDLMKHKIGKQYAPDDEFKASARLHQSRFRANVLKVDYHEYGNRLKDQDAKKHLNYYDGLNVRVALTKRYPNYSKKRDADMLRSEHMPFNLFAPLESDKKVARNIILNSFGIECSEIVSIKYEYAPEPKEQYLNDETAFDTYISYINPMGDTGGIGIEIKYTEREYRIGRSEKVKVEDSNSTYWMTTRASGVFIDGNNTVLGTDPMRQVWRNHLLGLSMIQNMDIKEFYSITLYPAGNKHFQQVIPEYRALLRESQRQNVFGCTFRSFFHSISGNDAFEKWKAYLIERYVVV